MALIIRGQMPRGEGCDRCEFQTSTCGQLDACTCFLFIDTVKDFHKKRHRNCPILGKMPDEHGRLIDADDLIEEIREAIKAQKTGDATIDSAMAKIFNEFIGIITNTPTIVEATE